ncbi:MAG TPA: dTDP-glucose 4,6-dehydratase [Candidatus Binatia bacterium]|nr:dTDP-glucose 4,6-dehydratase [Candidatus Binatia bacterium]
MKTLLVTGGCGFIGSHFVRLVIQKKAWRVINLDKLTYAGNPENLDDIKNNSRYAFARGDITDPSFVGELFQKEKPWAVVNFAAESHVDRSIIDASPFLQTNVSGVQVLLDAARQHQVERFLQVSTDEIYGDADGKEPFQEEDPLKPSSPYAASKAAADLLCLAYRRTYELPLVITRSSNNYGPFQFPEKLVPLVIRNALNGDDLPVYGDGMQRRDWLYVEDNVRGIFKVMERGRIGSTYNLGTGEERTNLDVVQVLCDVIAQEANLDSAALRRRIRFIADRPGHDRRYALNFARARQELQWSPQLSFEAALRRTVCWYLDNQEWVKRVTSGEYLDYYKAVYTHTWGRARR